MEYRCSQPEERVCLSMSGEYLTSFGRKGKAPVEFNNLCGLAVDKKGALHVCDRENNRIQIFF